MCTVQNVSYETSPLLHGRQIVRTVAIAMILSLVSTGAVAADVPDMVGTWKPTGESAGARIGAARAGWAASSRPTFNPTPRPSIIFEKQEGRGVSGYELLPDGSKDPFVGVFRRDGKQLLASTNVGIAMAEVSGNEMEWCWLDHLPLVAVAVCDVMKKER
jgi:hypothetical protein